MYLVMIIYECRLNLLADLIYTKADWVASAAAARQYRSVRWSQNPRKHCHLPSEQNIPMVYYYSQRRRVISPCSNLSPAASPTDPNIKVISHQMICTTTANTERFLEFICNECILVHNIRIHMYSSINVI